MRIVSPLLGLDLHAVDICNTWFHRIFGLFFWVFCFYIQWIYVIHGFTEYLAYFLGGFVSNSPYINHMAQVMVYMLMVCLSSYE